MPCIVNLSKFNNYQYTEEPYIIFHFNYLTYEIRFNLDLMKRRIKRNTRNRVPRETKTCIGTVIKNPDGFAFVTPLKKTNFSEDIFLNKSEARDIISQDIVEIAVSKTGRRFSGRLLRIIDRKLKLIVGEFLQGSQGPYVEIYGKGIELSLPVIKTNKSISPGSAVLVKIHHSSQQNSKAEIVSVLSKSLDESTDIMYVMSKYGLEMDFPENVIKESKKFPNSLREEDYKNRKDLRELPFLTIDGEDAKDFDDAVYSNQDNNGDYTLLVAIADVSHYVDSKSAIDKEALKRTSSVYLPNFVSPMLPENLSNGICSLNPKEDRLVMVAEIKLSKEGKKESSKFYEAVIRSHRRCTYDEIHDFINKKKRFNFGRRITKNIENLHSIFKVLQAYREKKGNIALDIKEKEILVKKNGDPIKIKQVERFESHQMIEESMIAANEAVASFLHRRSIPSIYRIHEKPKIDSINKFAEVVHEIGFPFKLNNKEKLQIQYQDFLKRTQKSPLKKVINFLLLRSMNQAQYSIKNIGHFALASTAYSHFTSPIRRYSDLTLHRILKRVIISKKNTNKIKRIQEIAAACSEQERVILTAEREINRIKEVRLATKYLGSTFTGRVVGMNQKGLFIELNKLLVEAFLPIERIGYNFQYNDKKIIFYSKRSNASIQLGQELVVQIVNTNPQLQRIELEPVKIKNQRFHSTPSSERKAKETKHKNKKKGPEAFLKDTRTKRSKHKTTRREHHKMKRSRSK